MVLDAVFRCIQVWFVGIVACRDHLPFSEAQPAGTQSRTLGEKPCEVDFKRQVRLGCGSLCSDKTIRPIIWSPDQQNSLILEIYVLEGAQIVEPKGAGRLLAVCYGHCEGKHFYIESMEHFLSRLPFNCPGFPEGLQFFQEVFLVFLQVSIRSGS